MVDSLMKHDIMKIQLDTMQAELLKKRKDGAWYG